MGRGAEEECVNGRGHGISEEGGGKKRWRTGADHFGEHMTCILKDMRQGEGSDGRGIRAKVGNKRQAI